MLARDKNEFALPAFCTPDEITIGELLGALAEHADKALVFFYDGNPVRAGYHVTEVKAGQFAALDCGANAESWTEIFVQLWDVDEVGRVHMPARRFAAIIRKVADHVSLDQLAKLTFEVSDGVVPMQLYVELSPRPASCKPRDRWLEQQQKESCCTPSNGSKCSA